MTVVCTGLNPSTANFLVPSKVFCVTSNLSLILPEAVDQNDGSTTSLITTLNCPMLALLLEKDCAMKSFPAALADSKRACAEVPGMLAPGCAAAIRISLIAC